jgi:hypothetical protein
MNTHRLFWMPGATRMARAGRPTMHDDVVEQIRSVAGCAKHLLQSLQIMVRRRSS